MLGFCADKLLENCANDSVSAAKFGKTMKQHEIILIAGSFANNRQLTPCDYIKQSHAVDYYESEVCYFQQISSPSDSVISGRERFGSVTIALRDRYVTITAEFDSIENERAWNFDFPASDMWP